MSQRTLAAALTVLVAVSVLVALAPTPAHAPPASARSASASSSGARPAAPVFVYWALYNGYGYRTNTFYVGQAGENTLYFAVTDFFDRAVNITITDPNALRDKVPAPAFHYEATLNATTGSFDSFTANVGYTFPSNLTYGGQWSVNFSAPVAGTVLQNVSVDVYGITLATSVGDGATLPQQPVSVFWDLFLWSNEATLYTRATNVWITGTYRGNGTVQNIFPTGRVALTPTNTGMGEWSGVIPANATPDSLVTFQVYAITNATIPGAENESANISVPVGTLSVRYTITAAPPDCSATSAFFFPTGSVIGSCVLAGADYLGSFTPISGLPVTVAYWNGTHHVTPNGGAPTALVTNASGEAALTFLATTPPFVQEFRYPVYNAVNFTVTVPGATTHYVWTVWVNATWALVGGSTASGVVSVTLDHSEYYPGATANVTWSIASTNLSKTGAVVAIGWTVTGPDSIGYFQGILNQSASSGTFTFPITAAMAPNTIRVAVLAANATEGFIGAAEAMVLTPSLLLTPSETFYNAGSTVTVSAVLNGGGAGATVQYELWGYWAEGQEALLANGTVANGASFPIVVPVTSPPLSIAVEAWATSSGQVIASRTITLDLAQGYSVLLGVSTPSSYADGSYQPGQTITLSYQVLSVGGAGLPQTFSFELIALGYPTAYAIQNVNATGTVSFSIPSNAAQGTLLVELVGEGTLASATCFPTGTCIGVVTLLINPSPSVLNLELAPGSGITVGWMILLVLIIVVAVVLVLLLLRRGGRRASSVGTTTLAPPAPAPTTEPAAEWHPPESEPAPSPSESSSSPPPLPEPPAKSS